MVILVSRGTMKNIFLCEWNVSKLIEKIPSCREFSLISCGVIIFKADIIISKSLATFVVVPKTVCKK